MKELSVVEMQDVSGAGLDFFSGAIMGALSSYLFLSIAGAMKEQTVDFTRKDSKFVLQSSMLVGALAGTIAEYKS